MEYSFKCYGHENITSKHKTTLEFTKDKEVSLQGDCIVGVGADFSLPLLKRFIAFKKIQYNKSINSIKKEKNSIETIKNKIRIFKDKIPVKTIIKINNIWEEINGFLNEDFDDSREIVIRKSEFVSDRTLVFKADKSADDLNKNIKNLLRKVDSVNVRMK